MSDSFKSPAITLYHYCSIESFFNIIKSGSIWLSNCIHMNDKTEFTWANRFIDPSMEKIKGILSKEDYDEFSNTFDLCHLTKENAYIFSLSADKDLLSQWRGYADNCMGVAIGFNMSELKIPFGRTINNYYLSYNQVVYDLEHQKNIIDNHFKIYREKYGDFSYNDLAQKCAKEYIWYSIYLKNPSFREEKEYRIAFLADREHYNTSESENLSDRQYRAKHTMITDFFQYNFPDRRNVISELILAPKCSLDFRTLESFFIDNGYNTPSIIKSESTYK